MFSNKENVNILTSLLVEHGVRHAVVCPGSRNSPIVHNLNEVDGITCYPVTDERSAAFYALGICQATGGPVVVCVTSGSALMDTAPAVVEAYYQHRKLIVVSADRPRQWIDQLDGQTMQQEGALDKFVRKSVTLPEPHDEEERWYCNRLVNEALAALGHHGEGPVHINVPISEPLFEYSVEKLPEQRLIKVFAARQENKGTETLIRRFTKAARPMIVIGQSDPQVFSALGRELDCLRENVVVLHENLSVNTWKTPHFEEVLVNTQDERLMPDLIIYMGNTLVSKRLRKFLRKARNAETWTVRQDSEVNDTFMNLCGAVETDPCEFLRRLAEASEQLSEDARAFCGLWQMLLDAGEQRSRDYSPKYSQMAAVKYFEEQLEDMEYDYKVHYANSSSVRLGNIFAAHHIWCNRGVNGIDGSVSTAAGMSVATEDIVFCVTGDLSFLYDQNALWNRNLRGNLRVILLNNGCGGIFSKFDGLRKSDARDKMIMAYHNTSAQGICTQNDCGYIKATNMQEMQYGIVQLITMQTERPVVLEILTDPGADNWAMAEYMKFHL